ncbi:MAG TPA: hypothetical protein VHT50_08095 [Mycobacterium sp.]|nr:hypothetical protein [Mycobacterium sp.]
MIARAASLPRPPIFGIGRCETGGDPVDFEIGWPEIDRDTAWAKTIFLQAGLEAKDVVLITAAAWESPWFAPLVRAIREIGITYIPTEVFSFDAIRFATILQNFPVKAVVGLCADTISGLQQQNLEVIDLLADVEIIWTRPDALPLVADVGSRVAPIAMLGPALAIGLPGQPGALVNAREWRVSSKDGSLYVSTAADRTTAFENFATGLRGTVSEIDEETLSVQLA